MPNPNDGGYRDRYSRRHVYHERPDFRLAEHYNPFYPRSNPDLVNQSYVPRHDFPDFVDLSPPRDSPLRGQIRRYYPAESTASPSHPIAPYTCPHHVANEDLKEKEPKEEDVKVDVIQPIEKAKSDFESDSQKPKQKTKKKAPKKPTEAETVSAQIPSFKVDGELIDQIAPKKKIKTKKRKDTKRPRKSTLRRKPEEANEIYHMDKDVNVVNPRLEEIGNEMFVQPKFKPEKPKKVRVASAKPKADSGFQQISEKEYLETVYPHVNLDVADIHCARNHYKPWFKGFMQKVFESSNKMRYDMFIKRCIKTSPYNENSGFNYALLKRLANERSHSAKRSYERNTISYIAKCV